MGAPGIWRGALTGLLGLGPVLACGRTTLEVDEDPSSTARGGSLVTGGTEAIASTGGAGLATGGVNAGGSGGSGGFVVAGAAGEPSRGGDSGAAGVPGGASAAGAPAAGAPGGGVPAAGAGGEARSGRGGAAGNSSQPCEPPHLVCGDECVDPASDARHCGTCSVSCPLDFGCFDGICRRLERLTCDDLLVDFPVWGFPSRGLDLRPYTSSTLHWIGCATDGCAPSEFYCEDTVTTLAFGTENSILRSLVDLGDRLGDGIPDGIAGCATPDAPADKYNAPTGASDLEGVDSLDGLCRTLGYSHGEVVREATNFCPEPHATDPNGTRWDSNLESTNGAGAEYLCVLDAAPP